MSNFSKVPLLHKSNIIMTIIYYYDKEIALRRVLLTSEE